MTAEDHLAHLNAHQREAVQAPAENILVLAGAGSGKTRVLVHRMAWLIDTHQVSPFHLIAVTFTNKAANEMRQRIANRIRMNVNGMWVGTFHGLAHRMLRMHWQAAGLPEGFQILDSEDQLRFIKRTMKSLHVDDGQWPPKQVQWFINGKKDQGLRPQHIDVQGDVTQQVMLRVYQAYEAACQRAGVMDFAEILLRCLELWRQHPEILSHYQERFSHILIDEFQDTNAIQYAWIKLLAGGGSPVMAVGDDDQSIYGWRGAQIENIHRFSEDFNGAQVIRLEQNYRSTKTILQAANALIEHNRDRLGKDLWTEGPQGEPIAIYAAFNEVDEARFIVSTLHDWLTQGNTLAEAAILYRSNAQSRVLEEALIRAGLAYRVYGGMRFFERMEIKDALAYLRLVANREDDSGFERVVNNPPRGIGERTLEALRSLARQQEVSLWQAAVVIVREQRLPVRASNALAGFLKLIDSLDEQASRDALELSEVVETVLQTSGLWQHYTEANSEKAKMRLENLQELVTAAKQFALEPEEDQEDSSLSAFLAHAALEAGEGQGDAGQDCVQLMTLHAAKGLEFPLVFIAGMEEGVFPSQMAVEDPSRLAEERRLCYVGMTRAKQKLFLTHAEVRRQYGKERYHRASRFLAELPKACVQAVRLHTTLSGPTAKKSSYAQMASCMKAGDNDTGFQLGQTVVSEKLGEGVVLNYEGRGEHARVQVKFKQHGVKWLVVAYANLI